MPTSRQLHLFAFLRPVTIHTGGWRYPGAYPDANFNFAHLKRFAQRLEAARFDAVFMADHLAVLNMPMEALKRSHTVTSFEPFTLLSALAAVTERIGLVATASATFDAPFHIARRFASLDHLSGGHQPAGNHILDHALTEQRYVGRRGHGEFQSLSEVDETSILKLGLPTPLHPTTQLVTVPPDTTLSSVHPAQRAVA